MKFEGVADDELHVARIRGLPWSATKSEIADFFATCKLAYGVDESINFHKNREGRPSGEAYIAFASKGDLDEALNKDRKNMGSRYIEVFTAKPDEAKWAIQRDDKVVVSNDNVIKLRGLPWESSAEDILSFFKGITINPNSVMMTRDRIGRGSGEAYVQFNSKEDYIKAMKMDRETIGSRYIEIFPSSLMEALQDKMGKEPTRGRPGPYDRKLGFGRGFGNMQGSRTMKGFARNENMNRRGMGGMPMGMGGMPMGMGGGSGFVVRIRGLPFNATEEQVARWFSEVALPIHVEISYDRRGRPSGDGCAYFKTAVDAHNAMSKNKHNMGHRYIELFNDGMSSGSGTQEFEGFDMGNKMLMESGMNSMGMASDIPTGPVGMGDQFANHHSGVTDVDKVRALILAGINPQMLSSFGKA